MFDHTCITGKHLNNTALFSGVANLITKATLVAMDVLTLLSKYPSWESSITALVRDTERGSLISTLYPKIKLVYGYLLDVELLEEEV
jgi:hypothetical protein